MSPDTQPPDDSEFENDAPPGYRSQAHRQRYVPLMATLLVITLIAQMVLPVVIPFALLPMLTWQAMSQNIPQYQTMAVWQNELWYPEFDGPGRGRIGCTLKALDPQGKPLEKPGIELNLQPTTLVAGTDRLWAVSANEVAEVFADGSVPVVMHPRRIVQSSLKPFVYRGELALIDYAPGQPFSLFVFKAGEWERVDEVVIPSQLMPTEKAVAPGLSDEPADALLAIGRNSADESAVSWAPQSIEQEYTTETTGPPNSPQTTRRTVIKRFMLTVLPCGGVDHVFLEAYGKFYHRVGLPLKHSDADQSLASWKPIDAHWDAPSFCVVEQAPAVLRSAGEINRVHTFRLEWLVDGAWQEVARQEVRAPYGNATAVAFNSADGSEAWARIDSLGGQSSGLYRLRANAMEKLDSAVASTNVSTQMVWLAFALYGGMFGSPFVLMGLMVVVATILMKTHRDPDYVKGRVRVPFASLLRRCLASSIDVALWIGPIAAVWYWGIASRVHGDIGDFFQWVDENVQGSDQFLEAVAPWLLGAAAWLAFWTLVTWLMLSFGGFTLGKLLCGVRVVTTDLKPPGLVRALLRLIIWPVENVIFYAILAWSLIGFTYNQQRLADLVARCVVVKAKGLRKARAEMAGGS